MTNVQGARRRTHDSRQTTHNIGRTTHDARNDISDNFPESCVECPESYSLIES